MLPTTPVQIAVDTDTETEDDSGTEGCTPSTSNDVINITDSENEGDKTELDAPGFSPPSSPCEAPGTAISDTEQSEGEDKVPPIRSRLQPTSPPVALGKHARSTSDDVSSLATLKRPAPAGGNTSYGPVGISRSARHDRRAKERVESGTHHQSNGRKASLIQRLRLKDKGVKVDPINPLFVCHSLCLKWIKLDGPGRTSKWVQHVDNCVSNGGKCKNAKSRPTGTPTIDTMFKKQSDQPQTTPASTSTTAPGSLVPSKSCSRSPSPLTVPCRGLRIEHDERVPNITSRSPIGGRTSIWIMARHLYNTEYQNLTPAQKDDVRMATTATARWLVYLEPQPHIRSHKCTGNCDPAMANLTPTDICNPCSDLLCMKLFRNALNRPLPPDEKLKYVPNIHHNKAQAVLYGKYVGLKDVIEQTTSRRSPMMNFVIKVIKGEVKSDIFVGILHTMATKDDKESRGMKGTNFKRLPEFLKFCHAAYISSPQTYRLIEKHLPVPTERNLRLHRSKAPSFPIGITKHTFERAASYLKKIEYTGPVCISCDDTMVLSKITPYYDDSRKKWLLLGGIGDPVEVDDNAKDIRSSITDVINTMEKATKCRLWCLQVVAPGVPVFILAVMPISATIKAEDLLAVHNKLIDGLLGQGIAIASYACDGAATERKVISRFLEGARNTRLVNIQHPDPEFPPLSITIHLFGSDLRPIIPIQDPKHGAKTIRNNAFSGTRCLTIGNCLVHYLQIAALAQHPQSPLYRRDVFRVDRQNDLAPLRLFSSAFLGHVIRIAKEHTNDLSSAKSTPISPSSKDFPSPNTVFSHDLTGLVVWLYTFGEFFDAFQSRSLDMVTRILSVLRLYYFLDDWKSSLKALGYSEAQHFLTRDAQAIFKTMIKGFLGLVTIYPTAFDDPNYTLMFWLHMTEPCEHTFGQARRAISDPTFGDFIRLIPKLDLMALSALQTSEYEGDIKARASGYYHTHYSTRGLDRKALSSCPNHVVIQQCASIARQESRALVSLCSIPLTRSLCPPPSTSNPSTEAQFVAPPISEWFLGDNEDLDDSWNDSNLACELDEENTSPGVELDRLIRNEEVRALSTVAIDDRMQALAGAGIAIEVEEQIALEAMSDRDHEKDWAGIWKHLNQFSSPTYIPPLVLGDEVNHSTLLGRGAGSDFDLTSLVTAREAHETDFAKKAVRVGTLKPEVSITKVTDDSIDHNTEVTTTLARSILVKQIHETLKEAGEGVVSTSGGTRRARYEGKFEVTSTGGNATNASAVSELRAKEALKSRSESLKHGNIKCASLISGAGVTALSPVKTGSYGIVFVDDKLWIGEVVTMYARGGGKSGNHNWVHQATNITSLSNVVVKLWEHWRGREFISIVTKTAVHRAYRFEQVTSPRLVYMVPHAQLPERLAEDRIRITNSLFGVWEAVSAELPQVARVVGGLLRRRRAQNTNVEEDKG
ncbi:hypothetical protein FRC11_004663 [Ceratobasidium sp. 423]|nr:hypothetical protein FRC11_004663 [Ceratobasidium sp. 423]